MRRNLISSEATVTSHVELIGRDADCARIRHWATQGVCGSIVGVSNLGKSALLRRLCNPAAHDSQAGAFVYVDSNQMPERTARAFFTTTWHALTMALVARAHDAHVRAQAHQLYVDMVNAAHAMTVALRFDEGIALALENLPRPLVLCLDEFDEPYQHLEPQTFLNLRALKDRHGDALVYVTTTARELTRLTQTREQGEFYELVGPHVHYLNFWQAADTHRYCDYFAAREGVTFSTLDNEFIYAQTGGHPGLVKAVCYALSEVIRGTGARDAKAQRVIHQVVVQNLATDANTQTECQKIYHDLEEDERAALNQLHQAELNQVGEEPRLAQQGLQRKFIVRDTKDGLALFAPLFADYVRRQNVVRQTYPRGVYLNVDAGAVLVDGKAIETLSDLEYRLLLFLYGRFDQVCDKYAIVETVWGEEYIDKVDDARIEKLISRVRQKIEPDPAHPRYLISLRGRGYKLTR
jgi:hypothetical protein